MLADSLLERGGWIRAAPARALLARTAAEGAVPNQLWYIYVLESWLRHERADAQAHAAGHDAMELVLPVNAARNASAHDALTS